MFSGAGAGSRKKIPGAAQNRTAPKDRNPGLEYTGTSIELKLWIDLKKDNYANKLKTSVLINVNDVEDRVNKKCIGTVTGTGTV